MSNSSFMKIAKKMPILKTSRLLLRRLRPSDYLDMFEYASLPEVTKYLLWSPHPSAEYTHRYLRSVQDFYKHGTFFDWALIMRESGKMIGTCGYTTLDPEHLRAEVGYVLNPLYWGQGIATEAVTAVISYAFEELGVNRVEAHFMEGNTSSRRVMEKCGMTFEGIHKQYMLVKGSYRNIGICAVTRDSYIPTGCYQKEARGPLGFLT